MKAIYTTYNYRDSLSRINETINTSDNDYKEHSGIPSEDKLTFKNGFYVGITVLFVDIRGSKDLSSKHTRPVLAKIYRSYISEVLAVMKGNTTINDIYIEGDGVWAVFNTTTNEDVNSVFSTAAQISSLIDILNIKLKKKKYSELKVGIGLEDGESLYMKAGYKGHSINEIVWIGKVVGEAAKLSDYGNREYDDEELMLSQKVYDMLNDHNKDLLHWNTNRNCYHGYVINTNMNKWVKENS
ncbi:MAG: adenylate/guanylate cyclase domain-containing protein [Arcobacteraceae bacterium]|nr:adenylate/guanylate cyclase domain-containing protein [Arcobacteraceae bacterium]